jgi:hypothetical protein
METLTKKVVKIAKADLEKTTLAVYDVPELPVVNGVDTSPGLGSYDEPFLFACRILRAWNKKGCVQLIRKDAMIHLMTKVEKEPLTRIEDLVREGYFREEEGWFIPEHAILYRCFHEEGRYDNVSIQLAKGSESHLEKLERRILELAKEGYKGNYIAKLMGEGFKYMEIWCMCKTLKEEGKLKS